MKAKKMPPEGGIYFLVRSSLVQGVLSWLWSQHHYWLLLIGLQSALHSNTKRLPVQHMWGA